MGKLCGVKSRRCLVFTSQPHTGLSCWFVSLRCVKLNGCRVQLYPTRHGPDSRPASAPAPLWWILTKHREAALPEVLWQLPWQLGQTIPLCSHWTTEGRALSLSLSHIYLALSVSLTPLFTESKKGALHSSTGIRFPNQKASYGHSHGI